MDKGKRSLPIEATMEEPIGTQEVPTSFLGRVSALRFIRSIPVIPTAVGPNQGEVPSNPVLISDEARRLTSTFKPKSPVATCGSSVKLNISDQMNDFLDPVVEESQVFTKSLFHRPTIVGAGPPRQQELSPRPPEINGLGLKLIQAYAECFQMIYPPNN